ncbi:restriction endonuclease [Rhodococcus sp. YH3-3]|uniref:restriction endonuclease n=1 Tax=Rhodococcus sp. YH3-3 TaxID=1803579 RepID=UPI0007DB20D6|nr:restriction endonuclease [Rhodococcus sp. YH3-3]
MNYITTPHEAELNAAEKMKSWGFTDAVATTGGADGGIDVRSSSALAQVKWKGGAAGRPEMQQLYGARGTDTKKALFFFAASSYSKAAVAYADEVGIGLFTYDPLGEVTAVNAQAAAVLKSPKVVVSFPGWDFGLIGALIAVAALLLVFIFTI